jgi:hypothetical protein
MTYFECMAVSTYVFPAPANLGASAINVTVMMASQEIPVTDKTWAQFKIYVTTAHGEFRLTNQTAQQSSFHNMMIAHGHEGTMQGAVDDIMQLATATTTASDRPRKC